MARAPGLPGQRVPVGSVHLGDIQVLTLPADGTAVVAHKDDVVPQGREHLFQRIDGPSAGGSEPDALLRQCADSLRKVRRQLALTVQQGGVKVGGNEADNVHGRLLSPHS